MSARQDAPDQIKREPHHCGRMTDHDPHPWDCPGGKRHQLHPGQPGLYWCRGKVVHEGGFRGFATEVRI